MKRTLALSAAAPCCALAILFAACTGGSTAEPADDGQSFEQPAPKPETPAEPDTPDSPDDPDTPNDPDNPDNPGEEDLAYKTVKEVLQEILGDDYNDISKEISQNITLTAQTIDAVSDIFSDSKSAKDTFNNLSDKDYDINQVKKALVAQAEGKFSVTKKKLEVQGQYEEASGPSDINSNIYDISISEKYKVFLSGEFDYYNNHIGSLKGDIDISGLKIVSKKTNPYGKKLLVPVGSLKEELYDKFNLEDKAEKSLPELRFGLYNNDDFGLKHFLAIYDKYNKSEKLNIDAYFGSMDGRELVDVDNYTLFESDGNTAKNNKDTSIRSFDINELIDFTNKYHISDISNLIIYGDAKTVEVDWQLTNIIFEGDMSELTNTSTRELKGIIYFKDLPYDNKEVHYGDGQYILGAVRLNKLSLDSKFKLIYSRNSVVDLREVDEIAMKAYNPDYEKQIFKQMGIVYFGNNVDNIADLYSKFIKTSSGGYINNEYFGNGDRRDSIYSSGDPSSKKPRKLSEFEYYGNNSHYEHAAVESYNNDFSSVTTEQENDLKEDAEFKLIAKVTTFCPLC